MSFEPRRKLIPSIHLSRGESVSRRFVPRFQRAPLQDYSSEVYEFLRRSFEKEEEACTCHQYFHDPQSPRRTDINSSSNYALHSRVAQGNAKRKGHKRSVSYAGHIIVDKPFISERMGNSQGGGEIKGGKRDKPIVKRDKRAQFETQRLNDDALPTEDAYGRVHGAPTPSPREQQPSRVRKSPVAERKSPSAAAARAERERVERERLLLSKEGNDGRGKHLHISSAPSPIHDDVVHQSPYIAPALSGNNDVKMSSSSSGEAFVTPVDKSPGSYVSAKSITSPKMTDGSESYNHRLKQSAALYPSSMGEPHVERGGLMSHGWKAEPASRSVEVNGNLNQSPRPRSYSRTPSPGKMERRSMERVHSRESIQQRDVKATSREKSPSAVQRRESWRERSKSPGSRRASRTSRLDSEDSVLDQSSTGDPTKPLSPSLRRRRFHERKVSIARRSSSMSIGDPTDTYRAVRPFKSVDYAYGDGGEKKTIMVTDLDHAEVEMSKASRSTPNLSELTDWAAKNQIITRADASRVPPASQAPDKTIEGDSISSVNDKLTIEESTAKIAAAVEDIDCVFDVAPKTPTPVPLAGESVVAMDESTTDIRPDKTDLDSAYVAEMPQAEGESLTPAAQKAPVNLKSASASQLDVEKHVSKPTFIPEKVDFKQLEKFEGAMLINWFSTAFEGDVYISQRLTPDDLKVVSSQFCTHLMAAGVLKPLEKEGNAETRGVFRMDEMYHWARSEVQRRLSASSDSTPSKIDVTQWPPAVASLLAAEKEKQLLEVGKLKREKMEAFDKSTAPDAAAEADYQTKLGKLEEKIQLLSGEIERYQVLSGIEGLVGAEKTSVTTSTTDLVKEKDATRGQRTASFPKEEVLSTMRRRGKPTIPIGTVN